MDCLMARLAWYSSWVSDNITSGSGRRHRVNRLGHTLLKAKVSFIMREQTGDVTHNTIMALEPYFIGHPIK